MNYLVFPSLDNEKEIYETLLRLMWYLTPVLSDDSCLYVMTRKRYNIDHTRQFQVPKYLDPGLDDILEKNHDKIRFVSSLTDEEDDRCVASFTSNSPSLTILCLKEDCYKKLIKIYGKSSCKIVNIDNLTNRYESSLLLRLSSNDGKGASKIISKYKSRAILLKDNFKKGKIALLGTGPSLDSLDVSMLSDFDAFAINSMIVNEELMDILSPKLIIAPDPIFHSGCSAYAASFRDSLFSSIRKFDSYFIFPLRDYGIWETYSPADIKDKLIGIPLLPNGTITYNLEQLFCVRTTSNVLTLFLLPLAAWLSDIIALAGFDGRKIEDNDYFWNHSQKSQINNEMDSIKRCHPSFFNISYDDYYALHVKTLTEYFSALESNGKTIYSLLDSHLPPIKARYYGGKHFSYVYQPQVSIIMPAHNAEEYLEEAVSSVQMQSFAEWELLIVENNSTDNTFEIASRLAEIDSRIKLVQVHSNGVSAARNVGLTKAIGSYICFLDADDFLIGEDSLGRRLAEATKGRKIVYGLIDCVDQNSESVGFGVGGKDVVTYESFKEGFPVHINTIFGPSEILKSHRFDENVSYGEDVLYVAELTRRGHALYPVTPHQTIACYRFNLKSSTLANWQDHVNGQYHAYSFFLSEYKCHPLYPVRYHSAFKVEDVNRLIFNRHVQLFVSKVLYGSMDEIVEASLNLASNPYGYEVTRPLIFNSISRFLCTKKGSCLYNSKLVSRKNEIFDAWTLCRPSKTLHEIMNVIVAEIRSASHALFEDKYYIEKQGYVSRVEHLFEDGNLFVSEGTASSCVRNFDLNIEVAVVDISFHLVSDVSEEITTFDNTSPPMPLLIKPFGFYQNGTSLACGISNEMQPISFSAKDALPVCFVRLTVINSIFSYYVNGYVVGRYELPFDRINITSFSLGVGYFHRHWRGKIFKFFAYGSDVIGGSNALQIINDQFNSSTVKDNNYYPRIDVSAE